MENSLQTQASADKERAEKIALEQQLKERVREIRELTSKHEVHVDELGKKCAPALCGLNCSRLHSRCLSLFARVFA